MVQSLLLGAIIIGLVHGLEPGHGWPIAVIYSTSRERKILSAVSLFLSLISYPLSVVVVYVVFSKLVALPSEIMSLIAAALLIILGVMFIREKAEDIEESQHGHLHPNQFGTFEHEHEHEHAEGTSGIHSHQHLHEEREILTLRRMAGVAFVLGFAHEEEFALLAFVWVV